jgi:acetylornithine deacetylase/succinyl-diaminopimelate desuccinylase-like protein
MDPDRSFDTLGIAQLSPGKSALLRQLPSSPLIFKKCPSSVENQPRSTSENRVEWHPCVDPSGNIFGWRAGSNHGLKPILFGSHIDSVPSGGNFGGVRRYWQDNNSPATGYEASA